MKQSKYITLTLCALMLSACSKRTGIDESVSPAEMTVFITPDFRQMEKPTNLKALFYTSDGVLFGSYDLPPDGGKVTLKEDRYKVIIYNNDAQFVVFNNTEHYASATAQITTTKASFQQLPCPGILYTGVGNVSKESSQLSVPISARSTNVTLKIEVQGEQTPVSVSVSLRNIADAVNLSTGMTHHSSESVVNLSMLTDKGEQDGYYIFEGATFGCCRQEMCVMPDADKVVADITLEMPDGEEKTLTADITEALNEAQQAVTEISVDIRIENIISGLKATVTDWTTGIAGGNIPQN